MYKQIVNRWTTSVRITSLNLIMIDKPPLSAPASQQRLNPLFQNVHLEISFLDLIDYSSCLPFGKWCPCIRCWQHSVVCGLLKQGDDAA